ncbi:MULTISPECIES: conjugal transfer protein TrbF [Xanthobacter]|uniref:conjugal transfer protein TrbF n=1 Tax=Xanthobacter TaxID=279 RepID=UPI001E4F1DE8|nr:conjugal transfer protein TrbF [Xanthobacter autotrophicus]UDQ88552.1 conjugal transfer protein TrbF [Xanthobacter autotrophicus]
MRFKRAGVRYSQTSEPATPYQAAGQLWDERLGSARVQARNWRLMSFGCLTLAVSMAGGLLWQAGRSTVTPYVVEVDQLGQVKTVGPAVEAYRPTDAQIAYALARFIQNVRALPTDPIVVRQNWLEAYDFTTDRGSAGLNDYARANDPFGKVGKMSVAVEVTSVVRASDSSFQIRWIERRYETNQLAGTDRWTGILTIIMQPPRTEDRLRKNPLGIFVNGINWSRELGAGGS